MKRQQVIATTTLATTKKQKTTTLSTTKKQKTNTKEQNGNKKSKTNDKQRELKQNKDKNTTTTTTTVATAKAATPDTAKPVTAIGKATTTATATTTTTAPATTTATTTATATTTTTTTTTATAKLSTSKNTLPSTPSQLLELLSDDPAQDLLSYSSKKEKYEEVPLSEHLSLYKPSSSHSHSHTPSGRDAEGGREGGGGDLVFSLDMFGSAVVRVDTNTLTKAQLISELSKYRLETTGTRIEKIARLERFLEKKKKGEKDPKAKSIQVRPIKTPTWIKNKNKRDEGADELPPGWR